MFIIKIKRFCQIFYLKTRKDSTYNLILFSLEFFNLTIFSLCVYRIITKKINNISKKLLFSKKYTYRKIIKDDIIEDNEANLNKKDKVNQLIPKIKKSL